jgi:hypothetical protein
MKLVSKFSVISSAVLLGFVYQSPMVYVVILDTCTRNVSDAHNLRQQSQC